MSPTLSPLLPAMEAGFLVSSSSRPYSFLPEGRLHVGRLGVVPEERSSGAAEAVPGIASHLVSGFDRSGQKSTMKARITRISVPTATGLV